MKHVTDAEEAGSPQMNQQICHSKESFGCMCFFSGHGSVTMGEAVAGFGRANYGVLALYGAPLKTSDVSKSSSIL